MFCLSGEDAFWKGQNFGRDSVATGAQGACTCVWKSACEHPDAAVARTHIPRTGRERKVECLSHALFVRGGILHELHG